jgi:hypothetical protein
LPAANTDNPITQRLFSWSYYVHYNVLKDRAPVLRATAIHAHYGRIRKLVRSTLRALGINFRTPIQAIFTHSELDSGRSECSELIFESGIYCLSLPMSDGIVHGAYVFIGDSRENKKQESYIILRLLDVISK